MQTITYEEWMAELQQGEASDSKISHQRGVRWVNRRNRWGARAGYNGEDVFLGYFKDERDAIIAVLRFRETHPLADSTLREASKKPRTDGESKYKGVYKVTHYDKWKAGIAKKGKKYYLGAYSAEIEAAKAYDKKAIELYGEYAYTNRMAFPEDFNGMSV